MSFLQDLYDLILSPALLACVLLSGIYITARLGGSMIRHPILVCKGLFIPSQGKSTLSSWRALTVALAGTLGVGNIAGVASAIAIGGAGAVFWMWMGALLSMLIKYSEVVLAVRYRKPTADGYSGGAMCYFKSPCVAILFAVFCLLASFGLGNILQARTVALAVERAFDLPPIVCGILLSLLLYLTICRGFTRISAVTLYLVPLMSGVYVLLCMIVIVRNYAVLPSVLGQIFREAFIPRSLAGGVGGFALARVIRAGISRGLITHEAGCGTAPMAHAEADTDSPVRQGFMGIFEVFADTIVLCTLTALALLSQGMGVSADIEGMDAVIAAFTPALGSFTAPILAILVFCFALATMIGWSFYGKRCLDYLAEQFTTLGKYKKLYATAYSFLSLLGVITASGLVWLLADYSVACMTLLHIPSLLPRIGEVARLTKEYFRNSD